ncbi:TadE/TadG family type IV pilus assembly protein [Rubripirellula reticaptiva]|uniref:TadE-like protein n=1 Tax=Rubripirellula reticaptiva TaxID=2528013 RepID=A0A5C6ERM5_9BACT|nr:TadE/TadG family type IV pilus assembly protein [Rubripirellula reticaptiva]TWU51598.1 TadE-like protein [Rubripirellula reticaptiva]
MSAVRQRTVNRHPQRHGAVVVEFAIAISILLLLVFASLELFRLNMLKHSVEQASYQAARKGIIIGAKVKDVEQEAKNHLANLGVSNAAVTISPGTITDDTQVVQVDIDVPITGNSWVSPVYFFGNIHGKTRMLAERAAADMMGTVAPPP